MRRPGSTALFRYVDATDPNGYADYAKHDGQVVTVLRIDRPAVARLGEETAYRIQALDGWTGIAYGSELREVPGTRSHKRKERD